MFKFLFALAAFFIAASAASAQEELSHLPARSGTLCGIEYTSLIQAPAADVPAEYRAFSGLWTGNEVGDGFPDGPRCITFIVEKVSPDASASLYVLYGAYGPWNSMAETGRYTGKIEGDRLEYKNSKGRLFVLTLQGDHLRLHYHNQSSGRDYTGIFHKE